MPSKKKKFNSRFPPARIKKIMQTDEEVGKVAAAVPVIISRALEKFIETLIVKTGETTSNRNAKTLTATHIKQTIVSEKKFDFLRDLVSTVPDHQAEDEGESSNHGETKKQKRPRKQREKSEKSEKRRGRKKKSSESSEEENNHNTNNGDDNPVNEDPAEDEDDDEDTETDEDDHSSESHPAEPISYDQSFNASLPSSAGLAQKSSFSPPISHSSSTFIPPYVNKMPSVSHMMPSNPFVPLMPPFPSSGMPPVIIDESNQPLDLCTTSSSSKISSVVKTSICTAVSQNSEEDDDYDT
ncbi:uncharacterized protein LOC143069238 [Mytilus galloprovincialis]|uniref:Dr1-associated corepressor n=2 Tax=Mytilus TaxID=6548 RepID=A0A8B6E437_MYTGA|nr:DRAP1 [Mytilus edulis]VDI28215.1 Hypothetical predicted protein [Mytilus galloprovincialis]